jgi:hypothetical protein
MLSINGGSLYTADQYAEATFARQGECIRSGCGPGAFLKSVLVFVLVVAVALRFRAGQLFEEIGILDGGGDLVVSAGPLAEVEEAATIGTEREVLVRGEDDFATDGAEESFWHNVFIVNPVVGGEGATVLCVTYRHRRSPRSFLQRLLSPVKTE